MTEKNQDSDEEEQARVEDRSDVEEQARLEEPSESEEPSVVEASDLEDQVEFERLQESEQIEYLSAQNNILIGYQQNLNNFWMVSKGKLQDFKACLILTIRAILLKKTKTERNTRKIFHFERHRQKAISRTLWKL